MTAADESRVVWRHDATPPAEGLRRAIRDARLDMVLAATPPAEGLRVVTAPDFGQQYSTRGAPIRSTTSAATPPAEGLDVERLGSAAVALCQLWFTDNAPDGSPHIRKAMLDLRAALAPEQPE
jgi:hypothetical protein